MEIYQQVMLGGTFEQIEAIVHVHLVVAGEEVDLHARHTDLLTPCELLFTIFRLVQTVLRCRGTIHPTHTGVIPYHRSYALRLGIVDSILDGLPIFHPIPLCIDEHIRQMERGRHVDILTDDVVIVRTMIISPIDPRYHTRMNPTGILQLAWLGDIGNQCRLYNIGQFSNNHHTPGTVPAATDLQLILIRGHPIEFPFVIKARSTLSALDIRLRNQCKHILCGFEERRIAPTDVPAISRFERTAETAYG